jgi:hypothetical protein
MNAIYLQYALYAYLSFSSFLLVKQTFFTPSQADLEGIVAKQLRGQLKPSAELLTKLNETVNTMNSSMVTHDELESRASAIINDLDKATKDSVKGYMKETKSKVDAISRSIQRLNTTINKGKKVMPKPKKPLEPPPDEWGGITVDQIYWCQADPNSCAVYPFVWESAHQVNDKPLARFSTPNIFGNDFKIDLNLAFKVDSIMYREDPKNADAGAIRNQSIFINAGYFNESGKFVGVAKAELIQDKDNYLIHSPTSVIGERPELDYFDFSLLAGPSYNGGFGLSVGGGIVNLLKSDLRIGGQVQLSDKGLDLGAFVAYRVKLLNRKSNIAPFVGYTWNAVDLSPSLNAGVYFIAW